MIAVMVKDDYLDITKDYPYEIDRIYSDGHIKLKNSPRKYLNGAFIFFNGDKKINYTEAYRLQQLEVVKQKLGIK